jgi:hypothetical protein
MIKKQKIKRDHGVALYERNSLSFYFIKPLFIIRKRGRLSEIMTDLEFDKFFEEDLIIFKEFSNLFKLKLIF